jgi:hypothetical protein
MVRKLLKFLAEKKARENRDPVPIERRQENNRILGYAITILSWILETSQFVMTKITPEREKSAMGKSCVVTQSPIFPRFLRSGKVHRSRNGDLKLLLGAKARSLKSRKVTNADSRHIIRHSNHSKKAEAVLIFG